MYFTAGFRGETVQYPMNELKQTGATREAAYTHCTTGKCSRKFVTQNAFDFSLSQAFEVVPLMPCFVPSSIHNVTSPVSTPPLQPAALRPQGCFPLDWLIMIGSNEEENQK